MRSLFFFLVMWYGAVWGADQKPVVINPTTGKTENLQAGNFLTVPNASGTLIRWVVGTGAPNSVVTAGVGSAYYRTDGGAATTLYIKESGAGNTGWVAVGGGGGGGITGTLTATRVPYATGASTVTDNASFVYNATTGLSANGVQITGASRLSGSYGGAGIATNLALGDTALRDVIDADTVIGIGSGALQQLQTNGSDIGIGSGVLGSSIDGSDNVVIGHGSANANTSSSGLTVIGSSSLLTYTGNGGIIALGPSVGATLTTGTSNILMGSGVDVSAGNTSNVFVAGSLDFQILDVFFAQGMSHETPTAWTLHGTAGSGTNIDGAGINIGGGRGTGTGAGGPIQLQTSSPGSSGTSENALVTRLTVAGNGVVSVAGAVTSGVSALTDAGTIATNAALGNEFTVTLGGNRTMGAPTNPIDGQKILYRLTQDATGTRTITWDGVFAFSTSLPAPVLSATGNKIDYVDFVYSAASTKWHCLAYTIGF